MVGSPFDLRVLASSMRESNSFNRVTASRSRIISSNEDFISSFRGIITETCDLRKLRD